MEQVVVVNDLGDALMRVSFELDYTVTLLNRGWVKRVTYLDGAALTGRLEISTDKLVEAIREIE